MYERVFATSCLHSRCVLPFARWLWISAYEILIGGLCDCAYAYAAPVTCDAPAATCASMCARLLVFRRLRVVLLRLRSLSLSL